MVTPSFVGTAWGHPLMRPFPRGLVETCRAGTADHMDASPSPGLVGALAAKIDGEVHFDDGTHYRHRLRPPSHYSMGWLPLWARIASIAPSTLNAVVHTPPIARVIKRA